MTKQIKKIEPKTIMEFAAFLAGNKKVSTEEIIYSWFVGYCNSFGYLEELNMYDEEAEFADNELTNNMHLFELNK